MESKETKQCFTLVVKEVVVFSNEISEEMKWEHVGKPKLLWQLSVSILNDFEDPFT